MPLQTRTTELVLASRSPARIALLKGAGLVFGTAPADLDEETLRAGMSGATPDEIAGRLAAAKAVHVSAASPDALVIGADQVLALGDNLLSKPKDMEGARMQLSRLSGMTHRLYSAVACVHDGHTLWQCVEHATLAMRPLSPGFIEAYLGDLGETALHSVGAYQLEGLGAQLFTSIEGDYFTILGLPLLPLLAFLRAQGVLRT